MKLQIKAHTCEWMRRISIVLTILLFLLIWLEGFGISKGGQRFIDLSKAGYTAWIFLIVGAIVVLLQLIPAIIYLFGFLGSGHHMLYTVKKEGDKDEVERDQEAGC